MKYTADFITDLIKLYLEYFGRMPVYINSLLEKQEKFKICTNGVYMEEGGRLFIVRERGKRMLCNLKTDNLNHLCRAKIKFWGQNFNF